MTPFSQLLEEVADEKNNSLSSVLFKAKLLASRLRSRKFQMWVDAELEGYPDRKTENRYQNIGFLNKLFLVIFGVLLELKP